ncbi:acyl-CoA thioesterase [Moheibacter stercoris]|uniref:Acyl-CoA thioester hydrolase n=1 Tax=Moheibacter stercoris TaxID=1628251 RepID=A0ABV2LSM9_9FLAO
MISTKISVRVRYGETDQMGVVYHGNYPSYFEVARVEFFRELGLPYKELEANGIMLPVVDLGIKYLKPAYYDDLLHINTRIPEIPKSVRFRFEYSITNDLGEVITEGFVVLAFIDKDTRKPIRCPEYLTKKMEDYANQN